MSSRILTLLQTVRGTVSNPVFNACVRNLYHTVPLASQHALLNEPAKENLLFPSQTETLAGD